MKIAIVDDTVVNLNAAWEAAKGFPEHEFVFFAKATQALKAIPNVDALITDLFFPEEPDKKLVCAYASYVGEVCVDNLSWHHVYFDYYARYSQSQEAILAKHQLGLRDGITEEGKLGRQFAYGGALMLTAKAAEKKACLVTNLHRHDREMDGVTALLPLISAGIASYEEVLYDGRDGGAVMGMEAIIWTALAAHGEYERESEVNTTKTNPAVWSEAIRRILAQ